MSTSPKPEIPAKEGNARTTKEAREARNREQVLNGKSKRRKTEARIVREKTEMAAEARRRQLEITAQREKEAAVVEHYLVSETNLISCGAGLNIQRVIPGFELCRIIIKNLPGDSKREAIVDLFFQKGLNSSQFFLLQVKEDGNKQEAVVLANAEHGKAIALGLDGIEFRDEVLSFSVRDNASLNALRRADQNIPFIMVSWRIPAETIAFDVPIPFFNILRACVRSYVGFGPIPIPIRSRNEVTKSTERLKSSSNSTIGRMRNERKP